MLLQVVAQVTRSWHYWLSWFIVIPFVLILVAMTIAYVVKVMAAKYPRQ